MHSIPRLASIAVLVTASLGFPAFAVEDAPPVDPAQLLQLFKQVKEAQMQQSKAQRQKAIQEALSAAGNPARGADLWEQAVLATRFDGASRESSQFRDWKDKEGDALHEKEIQDALRLHFNWLALTLQKMNGSTNRELMPAVIQHTKEATAHQVMMENFEESAKRDKELAATGKHGNREKEKKTNDDAVRNLNRQLMNDSVSASVVARWLKLDESISEVAPRKGQAQGAGWESSAGNVDGIFELIILPELRDQKDPRILEYWDARLKREAESAARSKLSFDIEKFNTIARPKLLWQRAQDIKAIGLRNRAINEMVSLIKLYPTHPDAANWISSVELEIMPAPAVAPAPAAAAAAAPAQAAAPALPAARSR